MYCLYVPKTEYVCCRTTTPQLAWKHRIVLCSLKKVLCESRYLSWKNSSEPEPLDREGSTCSNWDMDKRVRNESILRGYKFGPKRYRVCKRSTRVKPSTLLHPWSIMHRDSSLGQSPSFHAGCSTDSRLRSEGKCCVWTLSWIRLCLVNFRRWCKLLDFTLVLLVETAPWKMAYKEWKTCQKSKDETSY